MEKNYRIKIVRGNSEIEIEGDKEFVLEMLGRYEAKLSSSPSQESGGKVQSVSETITPDSIKGISVGEFIRKIGFKKHVDFVLAFGYFLEKNQGISDFSVADISTCYYDAKLESSNTSHMIILNIKRGFMMEAKQEKGEGKKKYRLTGSGETHILGQLSQNHD